jgi:hypothetical protein
MIAPISAFYALPHVPISLEAQGGTRLGSTWVASVGMLVTRTPRHPHLHFVRFTHKSGSGLSPLHFASHVFIWCDH